MKNHYMIHSLVRANQNYIICKLTFTSYYYRQAKISIPSTTLRVQPFDLQLFSAFLSLKSFFTSLREQLFFLNGLVI